MQLSDLLTQVKQRLNLENATHITDSEVYSYLNSSLSKLYGLVVEACENWNINRLTYSISDNALDGYVLPINFYKIKYVERQMSNNNTYYPLVRINDRDEWIYSYQGIGYNTFSPVSHYSTEVNQGITTLRVYPPALQVGNYRIKYYPAWEDLDADGYITIGPTGQHWEEYAILDTCIKICIKDETDFQGFALQLATIEKAIQAEASERDVGMNEPPPMTSKWYNKGRGRGFGGVY